MTRFYSALLFALLIQISFIANADKTSVSANMPLLHQLDDIVKNHQHYIDSKEESLRGLKGSLRKARTDRERISILKVICDSYMVYNADSALNYATRIEEQLEKTYDPGSYQLIEETKINQAHIYAILGLFAEADRKMDEIDPNKLDNDTKIQYLITDQYINAMKMVFFAESEAKSNEFNSQAVSLLDTLNNLKNSKNPDHLWIPIAAYAESWKEKSEPTKAEVETLEKYMETVSTPSREAAINYYWLSRYYQKKGDEKNMVKYLILAAINDAKIENREVAAIQELANWLFTQGDLERAYDYFIYCSELANLYQNRNRMISISNMFPSVRNAYMSEINKRDHTLKIISIILGVVAALLICCSILLTSRIRKLNQARGELKELNQSLNETVSTLEATNNDLREANFVKHGMISLTFKLTSNYISVFDDFRNKVLKRFTQKKYDDVKSQLMDPQILEDMYSDFYKNFDKTILSIFPNFVEEYNMLADDESKVSKESVEKTKTLNTRMRIYALKRLGIEKSGQIAKVLNISVRTVYNNKL